MAFVTGVDGNLLGLVTSDDLQGERPLQRALSLEAQLGNAIERQAAFYAARAAGGAALMITGGFAPNAEGRIVVDVTIDAPGVAEPAVAIARQLPDKMKVEGILLGLAGRYGNVLKMRPPLVFSKDNADQLLGVLDRVLP